MNRSCKASSLAFRLQDGARCVYLLDRHHTTVEGIQDEQVDCAALELHGVQEYIK